MSIIRRSRFLTAVLKELFFHYFLMLSYLPSFVVLNLFRLYYSLALLQKALYSIFRIKTHGVSRKLVWLKKNKARIKDGATPFVFFKKVFREKPYRFSKPLIQNILFEWVLWRKWKNLRRQQGEPALDFISISPSTRCDLQCIGCYAQDRNNSSVMTSDQFSNILSQARALRAHTCCVTGGEPFLYPYLKDVIRNNPDYYFLIFTNGLHISDKLLSDYDRIGNFAVLLSLEGYEEETDRRRGLGVFKKVLESAQLLKKMKRFWGFTVTLSRSNGDVVSSESYLHYLLGFNPSILWFSTFLPVDGNSVFNAVPSATQRLNLKNAITQIRKVSSTLIIDFANDSRFVDGCTGGGKKFIHISNNGDVELCNFSPISYGNVYQESLEHILSKDFYREIRLGSPFSRSYLTPCLMDCNIDVFKGLCSKYLGETCTDTCRLFSPENIELSRQYRDEIHEEAIRRLSAKFS